MSSPRPFRFGVKFRSAESAQSVAGVRIERMAEALEVMKGLWSDGAVTYRGQHYTIDGLDGWPKPRQLGGPPTLIGGGGWRLLGVAARLADIVGINPIAASGMHDRATNHDGTPEATDREDRKNKLRFPHHRY